MVNEKRGLEEIEDSEEDIKIRECEAFSLRYQQGDKQALEKIMDNMKTYIPGIASCEYARRLHKKRRLGLDDIEGCVIGAVWKAAEDWNPSGGASFLTHVRTKLRSQISSLEIKTFGNPNRKYKIQTVSSSNNPEEKSGVSIETVDSGTCRPEEKCREYEYSDEKIGTLIENLLPKEREIAYLKYVEGMTQEQIRKRLGVTSQNIGQKIKRMNKKVRQKLEELEILFNPRSFNVSLRKWYENHQQFNAIDFLRLGRVGMIHGTLQIIAKVLYTIPDYQEAEKRRDKNQQLEILTRFMEQEPDLAGYFGERGLKILMQEYHDPEGNNGFEERNSPLAVLRFYSRKKGLRWFTPEPETSEVA